MTDTDEALRAVEMLLVKKKIEFEFPPGWIIQAVEGVPKMHSNF